MTTTNWMGSGNEVESATFHNPIDGGLQAGRSGFRGRLDGLKSRGMDKVQDVQRTIGQRGALLKSNMQTSMKTSPMKWVGLAAGSGFALGLLGRFLHWRNDHRRMTPDLVIIESSC